MGNKHKLISWFFKTKAVILLALLHPSLSITQSLWVATHRCQPCHLPLFISCCIKYLNSKVSCPKIKKNELTASVLDSEQCYRVQ